MKDEGEIPGPVTYVKILFYDNRSNNLSADIVIGGPHVIMVRKTGDSVTIDCPSCRHKIFVKAASVERTIRCPECGMTGSVETMLPCADPQDVGEGTNRLP